MDLLNLDNVASHLREATNRGRYQGPSDPREYLQHKHCIAQQDGETYATIAGLLCFGHAPQAVLPKAVVDIGHYSGQRSLSDEVLHLEKNIGGTLFDQLARTETYLWNNIHHGMRLSTTSFQRVEVHEYPRAVIRELCVNMLAHRDYTNFRSAARIMLFRNRIEWISPGGLPPGITVANLLDEQAARNPVILSILYEAGYVEAFGQGLDTVVAALEDEEMPAPAFRDTGASFIVTVFGRALDILRGEGAFGQLTESQRKIVTALHARGPLFTREITTLFADRGRRSVQRNLGILFKQGLIRSEGQGRAQRYLLADTPPTTDP